MIRCVRGLALGLIFSLLVLVNASAATAEALFEATVSLIEDGEATLFSVWPNTEVMEAWPDDPALLVRVTPPSGEAYSFLFPSHEGSDANAMVPLLRFKDMNGDGFLDAEALYAQGASNISCTYFLYDPADSHLHYSTALGLLSNAYYDPERHAIISQVHDGAARQYYSLYSITDGVPFLLRTASIEAMDENGTYVLKTTVSSALSQTTLLAETVPFDENEYAIWETQQERMEQAFYKDLCETPAPSAP